MKQQNETLEIKDVTFYGNQKGEISEALSLLIKLKARYPFFTFNYKGRHKHKDLIEQNESRFNEALRTGETK